MAADFFIRWKDYIKVGAAKESQVANKIVASISLSRCGGQWEDDELANLFWKIRWENDDFGDFQNGVIVIPSYLYGDSKDHYGTLLGS